MEDIHFPIRKKSSIILSTPAMRYKKTKRILVVLFLLVPIYVLAFTTSTTEVYIAPEKITQPEMRIPARNEIPPVSKIATVTAYSSVDSCHYPNCITASGKRAYVGGVACPRKLKLGTKVEIFGKIYTCEDRTAVRFDGRYDIFKGYGNEAHRKAIIFGIQKLEVRILPGV